MRHLLQEPELAIGKTVEGVHGGPYSDFLAVHFTDGSSLVVGCEVDGGESASLWIIRSHNNHDMDIHDRANYGLITQDEYKQFREQQDAERTQKIEQDDRATYERLKKRFEQSTTSDAVAR